MSWSQTGSRIDICTMSSLLGKLGEIHGQVSLYELLGWYRGSKRKPNFWLSKYKKKGNDCLPLYALLVRLMLEYCSSVLHRLKNLKLHKNCFWVEWQLKSKDLKCSVLWHRESDELTWSCLTQALWIWIISCDFFLGLTYSLDMKYFLLLLSQLLHLVVQSILFWYREMYVRMLKQTALLFPWKLVEILVQMEVLPSGVGFFLDLCISLRTERKSCQNSTGFQNLLFSCGWQEIRI